MTTESEENAYRTYCGDRLVVSESVNEVDTDNLVTDKEELIVGKIKKPITLIMK